jgi:hypothetical protein
MTPEAFQQEEYNRLTTEERERMNNRLAVWTLFFTVIGAFGFISIQDGKSAYAVLAMPYLLLCLAQFVRHNEAALKQIRKYLRKLAEDNNYQGYEHWVTTIPYVAQGSYMDALRNAFVLATIAAMASYVLHASLAWTPIALIDVLPLILMWRWLARKKRKYC